MIADKIHTHNIKGDFVNNAYIWCLRVSRTLPFTIYNLPFTIAFVLSNGTVKKFSFLSVRIKNHKSYGIFYLICIKTHNRAEGDLGNGGLQLRNDA